MRLGAWSMGAARRTSLAIIGAVALLGLAQLATSDDVALAKGNAGQTSIRVMIAETDNQVDKEAKEGGDEEKFESEKLEAMSKEAVKRIRARLEASQIKQFSVDLQPPRGIYVSARGGVPNALLAGIVVPQGQFELRSVESVGQRWINLSSKLPAGVEIRQEEGSLAAGDAYLYSRSRSDLEAVIAEAGFDDVAIRLYSVGAGWRTLALSEPTATHQDISGAAIRQGKTGAIFVEIKFNRNVTATPRSRRGQRTFAAVLDGEVVATFRQLDADFGTSLTISAPKQLGSETRRRMWAQQVAGRLAAYMPIPLVEMSDDAL